MATRLGGGDRHPLDARRCGPSIVVVHGAGGRQEFEFDVGDKQYATQSLKVAPRQVNPPKADLARIARERVVIDRGHEHVDATRSRNPCS